MIEISNLNWLEFVIACFAVFRLSHLLVSEDGPFGLAYKLRIKTGIIYNAKDEVVSWPDWNPLYCIWCTSIYVAILVCLSWNSLYILWIITATSAVASILNGYSKY